MSVRAIAHISRLRGGSQAQIMVADDGNKYVVKFLGNPQHDRVLANEYLACRMAQLIGFNVPEPVIIHVDEQTIREQQITFTLADRAVAPHPGPQFGFRLVTAELIFDFLPRPMLGQVRNWESGILRAGLWERCTKKFTSGSRSMSVAELMREAQMKRTRRLRVAKVVVPLILTASLALRSAAGT